MQTATLNRPRPAALTDLRPGDAVFVLATLGQTITAKLGTVVEVSRDGLRVQPEPTNPIAGQNGGPCWFDARGRYAGGLPGYRVSVDLPEGARRIGSLGVA